MRPNRTRKTTSIHAHSRPKTSTKHSTPQQCSTNYTPTGAAAHSNTACTSTVAITTHKLQLTQQHKQQRSTQSHTSHHGTSSNLAKLLHGTSIVGDGVLGMRLGTMALAASVLLVEKAAAAALHKSPTCLLSTTAATLPHKPATLPTTTAIITTLPQQSNTWASRGPWAQRNPPCGAAPAVSPRTSDGTQSRTAR
jgi:hypothetical protein